MLKILYLRKMWLLYACLLTMLTGCYKCIKDMQPKTLQSENFACILNGKLWLPSGNLSFPNSSSNPGLGYDETFNASFGVQAKIYVEQNLREVIGFSSNGINAVGEYNLDNSNIHFYYVDYTNLIQYESDKDTPSNCKLIVTSLDTKNKAIIGSFSFTITKTTGEKITVTDGRFNLKYL